MSGIACSIACLAIGADRLAAQEPADVAVSELRALRDAIDRLADPVERPAASHAIWCGGVAATRELAMRLRDGWADRAPAEREAARSAALAILAERGPDACDGADVLLEVFCAPDWRWQRAAVRQTLARILPFCPGSAERIERAAKEGLPGIPQALPPTVLACDRFRPDAPIAELRALVGPDRPELAWLALQALARRADEIAADPRERELLLGLARDLADEDPAALLVATLRAGIQIGWAGLPREAAGLVAALQPDDPLARPWHLDCLARLDPAARRNALVQLRAFRGFAPAELDALVRALDDVDPEVVAEAITTLAVLGKETREVLGAVMPLAQHPDRQIAARARAVARSLERAGLTVVHTVFRYPNGGKRSEGDYALGGPRIGIWRHYFANQPDDPDAERLQSAGAYQDGKEHGPWTIYHPNGQVESRGSFEAGLATGPWEGFHDDGVLRWRATFQDGKAEGTWTSFGTDGTPLEVGVYRAGSRVGVWRTYDARGNVTGELDYGDGGR
ncbi:MAG: hypothetical protein IPM29_22800 [Planctomycetes bacterium]|nr:hypothetical protein [Planctomycetota bacterium]